MEHKETLLEEMWNILKVCGKVISLSKKFLNF